jgi:hypothetical protein
MGDSEPMWRDWRSSRAQAPRQARLLRMLRGAFCGWALVVPLVAHAQVAGDCDGDGRVLVGELITAVNIALGTRPLEDCAPADANGDGRVLVSDLVIDVAAALGTVAGGFVGDQRIVYSDGLHNENTEMIRLGDRIVLIFRGGETGQIGSDAAHINVFESLDDGRTFTSISEVDASNLPGGRDIRDPKLVEMDGTLFLYAISRLPGAHYRDLGGQAWLIRAESTDGGHTWTAPMKTYEDVDAMGHETFWGFWRFTKRQYTVAGESRQTLFATGYQDGDLAVALFASDDGVTWQKRSTIIASYDDVPSEAELQFFGDDHDTAVALVRLDNQDILDDGQTAICTSQDPFETWECGRRIEQRLDGPTWTVRSAAGDVRSFVFARKHLPCTLKRTAAYELRGDLADPDAPIEVCEIQEVESSGDTAYTSLAPIDQDHSLLAWYSSAVDVDVPWLQGIYSPSDIWLADVDFRQAPAGCVPPPPHRPCEPAALPPGSEVFDVTGAHLLTLAPVIWPSQPVFFRADVSVQGTSVDIALQPLDGLTREPTGSPWNVTDVPVAADGSFTADFGTQTLPAAAYPLLNDPLLTVHELVLTGETTSTEDFCGFVGGYAQVFGMSPSDRIRLEGSTFAATRISGDMLPAPVSACAGGDGT